MSMPVPRRLAATLPVAILVAVAAPAAAEEGFDLEGTWHVLVHYTDSNAADTEVQRWDDRLWVFERKGSRLTWTEYPIVVFNDRSGRFETSDHGQTRVLGAWEPNSGQRAQIESGLEFNSRGSKQKSLRRKTDGSWQSVGGSQTLSATTIGYREEWSITWSEGAPTFTRDDILGSQRAESMSGRTQYRGEEVVAGGKIVRGQYARDESKRGAFRMMRSGAAASVGTKKSVQQRVRESFNPSLLEPETAEGGEAEE